jgi:ribonuclease Z
MLPVYIWYRNMIIHAGNFTIEGISIGGIEVSIAVNELDLAFDIGRCTKRTVRSNNLAISHAHADHLGAIGSYLSVRDLFGMSHSRIFVPEDFSDDVQEMIRIWEKLQRKKFDSEVVSVKEGSSYHLNRDHTIMPFRVFHTLPTMGYAVFRHVKKLKPEYIGLPSEKIKEMKEKNSDSIFLTATIPVIVYTSDTTVEIVEKYDFVRESRVLVIETTFLDDKKEIEKSRLGKHIHLEEFIEKMDLLKNEHIILCHFSQIYRGAEIQKLIDEKIGGEIRNRIHLMLFDDNERI